MTSNAVVQCDIDAAVPRRGNRLSRAIGTLVLWLMRWRFVGTTPRTGRFVMVAVPHTSNLDGFIFLMAMLAAGLDLRWVGKHTLFQGWLGRILLWAGGLPVDRQRAGDFAAGVAALYAQGGPLVVVIAAEGTRGRTTRWKSGFHRIAALAEVPIAIGYMDYGRRRVGFGPCLPANASLTEQLTTMSEFLADIQPRHPQRFALPEIHSQ